MNSTFTTIDDDPYLPILLKPDEMKEIFKDLLKNEKFLKSFSKLSNIPGVEGSEGKLGLIRKEGIKDYFHYAVGMEGQLSEELLEEEEIISFLHKCELLSQAALEAVLPLLEKELSITITDRIRVDLLTHSILRITLYDPQAQGAALIAPHTDRRVLTHVIYGDDTGATRIFNEQGEIIYEWNAKPDHTIVFPGEKAEQLVTVMKATLHDAVAWPSNEERLSVVCFISLPASYFSKDKA